MASSPDSIAVRLAAFALLAGLLGAQSVQVLPATHAAREGTGSTNVPFGRSTPARTQLIYDGTLFTGPVTITRIGLRLDGGATASGKQVDCEIRMSTCAHSLVLLSSDFAQNRGGDEQIVYPRQVAALPARSVGATPNPFHLHFDLAPTFAYDPAMGPLLVEIVVFSQQPGAYPLDATYVCTSAQQTFGPPACSLGSGQQLLVESTTTQVIWGQRWVVRVLNAPAGALTALVLGTREGGVWSGWQLPFDLAPLGAPGCFVSTDLAASLHGLADGNGNASYAFSIPASPGLQGLWLRFQGSAVDPSANSLGVVTSEARKVQVCGWEAVGRVWAAGLASPTGVREIGLAPPLQISIQ